jgi:hypothetical protein
VLKKLCASGLLAAVVVFASPTIALADHDFKVTNKGGHQVDHIYLSNPNEDSWGPDQLDSDQVLSPGDHQTWSIDDGCLQDVKIVYHNGHKDVEKNFDTCKYDLELNY